MSGVTELISTKPYMIRALHEWCTDNGCTPHLLVAVDAQTHVPMAYAKNGEIVLNLNYTATKDLQIENEAITFSARFGGVSQNLYIPMTAVKGIFARENGQGMFFEVEETVTDVGKDGEKADLELPVEQSNSKNVKKPTLTIVK